MITVDEQNKIEINVDLLKNNHALTSLMKSIKQCGINFDELTSDETTKIFKMILVASR